MFGSDYAFLSRAEHLTYEEITRVATVASGLGVNKLRLTGGEPLLRRDLPTLIGMLDGVAGVDDLTLTTNGVFLPKQAQSLADAGLRRITVSLDSVDPEAFASMTDTDHTPEDVLAGIDAAAEAGLSPIKVNAVVQRGLNDHLVLDLVEHFRNTAVQVRFIEFMDVGTTNGWAMERVVPSAELVAAISERWPLEPVEATVRGETARRWRYVDGAGEVGFISSVTEPFCADCTRLRLSAEGKLYTCLFGSTGLDLRGPLRDGATDDDLVDLIAGLWESRADRYSEERAEGTAGWDRVEMSYIGG